MNINQDYGVVDMPSEIADSFDFDVPQYKNCEYESHLIHDSRDSFHDQPNLDSSLEDDTFLQKIDTFINKKQQLKTNMNKNLDNVLTLSREQISRIALPYDIIKQSIKLVSTSSEIILIKVLDSPFEVLSNGKSRITQLYLQPYESAQIELIIKNNERGDIYETLLLEYSHPSLKNNKVVPKRKYIPVQVKFVRPKLKIKYLGCSDVLNVMGNNKVSMNRLSKNKFGQYQIELGINSGVANMEIQRMECIVSTRGNISCFPNEIIFFNGEFRNIFVKIKEKNKKGMGVLILKSANARANFIIGIELI